MTSSAFTASRIEPGEAETLRSSFSGGRRSPGASSPEMIISLIRRIASSVTAMCEATA